MSTPDSKLQTMLPHESGSAAELLAATHIFEIRATAVQTSEWKRGADGLEHRELIAHLVLGPVLKGDIGLTPGREFILRAPQAREGALTVSDWHGFWSQTELHAGESRIALAESSGSDPAELLVEPAVRELADPALAVDYHAAARLERQYASPLRGDRTAAGSAALALLKQVADGRARYGGALGRYVWARIAPVYAPHQAALQPAVIAIALAPDTSAELRLALVAGLDQETLDQDATPAQRAQLLGSLLRLLLLPQARPMREWLVQTVLHGQVFAEHGTTIAATRVVPDANVRRQLTAAISDLPEPRAQELARWLETATPP
jgi:hypothetical protein